MRKIKEVLRLKYEAKLSHEKIAAATGMSKGAVTNTVRRAVQKALGWPLPAELDESRLEALLYAQAAARERYAQPDYAVIHQELKRTRGQGIDAQARGGQGNRQSKGPSGGVTGGSIGSQDPQSFCRYPRQTASALH
jgi:Sigma-70, region 4